MTGAGTPWPPPNGGDPNARHWYSRNPREPIPGGPGAWPVAVRALRDVIRAVEQARRTDQLTLTALADTSGVPASTVRATINGQAWPMTSTIARLAGTVGLLLRPAPLTAEARHRLGLVARWTPPAPVGWRPPSGPGDVWAAYLAELRWLADAYDIRPVAWARAADVRPATVSELLGPRPARTDARFDTLTALSLVVGTRPAASPATDPQTSAWEAADEL